MNLPNNFEPTLGGLDNGFLTFFLVAAVLASGSAAVAMGSAFLALIKRRRVAWFVTIASTAVIAVMMGALVWQGTTISQQNDANVRANARELQRAAQAAYSLPLSEAQAIALQGDQAVIIGPDVTGYGDVSVEVEGERMDVALYHVKGQWVLVNYAKVADTFDTATLPLLG